MKELVQLYPNIDLELLITKAIHQGSLDGSEYLDPKTFVIAHMDKLESVQESEQYEKTLDETKKYLEKLITEAMASEQPLIVEVCLKSFQDLGITYDATQANSYLLQAAKQYVEKNELELGASPNEFYSLRAYMRNKSTPISNEKQSFINRLVNSDENLWLMQDAGEIPLPVYLLTQRDFSEYTAAIIRSTVLTFQEEDKEESIANVKEYLFGLLLEGYFKTDDEFQFWLDLLAKENEDILPFHDDEIVMILQCILSSKINSETPSPITQQLIERLIQLCPSQINADQDYIYTHLNGEGDSNQSSDDEDDDYRINNKGNKTLHRLKDPFLSYIASSPYLSPSLLTILAGKLKNIEAAMEIKEGSQAFDSMIVDYEYEYRGEKQPFESTVIKELLSSVPLVVLQAIEHLNMPIIEWLDAHSDTFTLSPKMLATIKAPLIGAQVDGDPKLISVFTERYEALIESAQEKEKSQSNEQEDNEFTAKLEAFSAPLMERMLLLEKEKLALKERVTKLEQQALLTPKSVSTLISNAHSPVFGNTSGAVTNSDAMEEQVIVTEEKLNPPKNTGLK